MKTNNVCKPNMCHFNSWQLISPRGCQSTSNSCAIQYKGTQQLSALNASDVYFLHTKSLRKNSLNQKTESREIFPIWCLLCHKMWSGQWSAEVGHIKELFIHIETYSGLGWDSHTGYFWRKHHFKLEWPLHCPVSCQIETTAGFQICWPFPISD